MRRLGFTAVIFLVSMTPILFSYISAENSATALTIRKRDAINGFLTKRFTDLESSIQAIAYAIKNHGLHSPDVLEISKHLHAAHEFVRTIIVAAPSGNITSDSRDGTPSIGRNISDRIYFSAHTTKKVNRVYLGKPVESRVDGYWSLPLSIPVRNEIGDLLAVIAIALDPEILSREILSTFAIGDYRAVVVASDNSALLSVPFDATVYGISNNEWLWRRPDASIQSRFLNLLSTPLPQFQAGTHARFDTLVIVRGEQVFKQTLDQGWKGALALLIIASIVGWHVSRQKKIQHELSNAKLAAEELAKRAENANRSKSEFLASMSHELRTPLNAILGYAQILKYLPEASLTAKQSEYVDNIASGGNHLLELVNDILDLARIESDRLSIFLENTSFEAILADTTGPLKLACKEGNVRLINEVQNQGSPLVTTDRVRCKQVLTNLLSNAIKFSRPGGRVWIRSAASDEDFLRISISDEGIGIPEEKQDDLFQLFYRADRDPMRTVRGSGVGLAVSKTLIERLGGRIGFESVEGVGSTFWFELPLTTNEKVLIWTDDYRVGVDAIDKDHQIIFRLTNKVVQHDLEKAELSDVISEMIEYTSYHFRREEVIMGACGYPDLEDHRNKHYKLEAYIRELESAWNVTQDPAALARLRSFLRNWWSGHIMDVDKTIAQYAKGHEAEILTKLAKSNLH